MEVYLLSFLLILNLVWAKNKYVFFVSVVALFFVLGLRDMIGSRDIYNYAFSYEMYDMKNYIAKDTSEPGFKAYTLFLKLFSSNRYFYFFVTSFVLIFLQMYPCYKIARSKDFYLLAFIVLCKFYLFDFVYLRQMMAMSLSWIAFAYYYNSEKKWSSFALFLLAVSFHRSALILIPIFFLLKLKIPWKKIVLLYALLIVITVSGIFTYFQNLLFVFIAQHFSYLEKLQAYVITDETKGIYLVEIPLVVGVLYYLSENININNHKKRLLYNSVFFYGLFNIISIPNSTLIRLSWFFFLGFAYSVILIYNNLPKKQWKPYVLIIGLLYYSAIFLRLLFFYDGGDFIPYKSIFQDFDRKGRFEKFEYRDEFHNNFSSAKLK